MIKNKQSYGDVTYKEHFEDMNGNRTPLSDMEDTQASSLRFFTCKDEQALFYFFFN